MAKGKVKTGVVKPLFTFSFRPTIEADAAGGADMKTVSEPGMGTLEIFPLATGELFLHDLIEDLFENHWRDIVFGSLIQGAVFEIRAPNAPTRISLLDDYLTVNFGAWHFHLCIGAHKGSRANPTDADRTLSGARPPPCADQLGFAAYERRRRAANDHIPAQPVS